MGEIYERGLKMIKEVMYLKILIKFIQLKEHFN